MAMQSKKAGSLTFSRGGTEITAAEKPNGHQDMYLCVALVVLLAWALYVGLGGVNWSALGHTFGTVMAWFG